MDQEIRYGPEQRVWIDTLSPIAKSRDGKLLVSPPSHNPLSFKEEPVISAWYQVPYTGLDQQQRARAITETVQVGETCMKNILGFQANWRELSHAECVKDFISTNWNNCGNPFNSSCGEPSTFWMERNVLNYYASLWHAKWPHNPKDPETYWGYTLPAGSSEGNLYAVWNARDYLSGKCMYETSENSKSALSSYHYSSADVLLMLQMPSHQLLSTPTRLITLS
jgi:histidine decarboxylase